MNAAQAARNALCPCGSGQRYKTCCGRVDRVEPRHATTVDALLRAAFDAHRAGRNDASRSLYVQAITHAGGQLPDAEHMLGVLALGEGDFEAALRALRDVTRRYAPAPPEAIGNLAIAVAALLSNRVTVETEERWLGYLAWRGAASSRAAAPRGRVSVVVPSYNHARYVDAALDSLLQQTRPPDEIVVIDDGSTDASPSRVRAFGARAGDRVRIVLRENRGAAATINEAIRLSTGDWVHILNSDDRFTPDRLEAMGRALASAGASWGFSRCRFVDAAGTELAPGASAQADNQRRAFDSVGAHDTLGMAFVAGNVATTSGTLAFSRGLFDRLGGFRDFRYVHDWDFCLRASLEDEPAFAPREHYEYRLHGSNTFTASYAGTHSETAAMLRDFHRQAQSIAAPANPYAPAAAVWGRLLAVRTIEAGGAVVLPPGVVDSLADAILVELAR